MLLKVLILNEFRTGRYSFSHFPYIGCLFHLQK
jgi:hypothetical protein